jgi:dihydroorotate dehydrogenase (fumarate)
MNLASSYLGLTLSNPLVVGASPFCDHVTIARRLQDAGAAAMVMRSLFQEQIAPPPRRAAIVVESSTAATETFPEYADYQLSPEEYLRQLDRLKAALTIPIIASLNGHEPGSWTEFATRLERAGADAIELNFYQVVTDPSLAADQIETAMLETVGQLTQTVNIPIGVKLSPFHASVAQLAIALELEGADGIVVFNRFYQPDISLEELEVRPELHLSDPGELLIRLRWLAILSPQLRGTLTASGGVHTWDGLVKSLLTGAHSVQLVSALLQQGPEAFPRLLQGLESWMYQHGYDHIDQFRGLLNLNRCQDPAVFERANYIRTLQSWK